MAKKKDQAAPSRQPLASGSGGVLLTVQGQRPMLKAGEKKETSSGCGKRGSRMEMPGETQLPVNHNNIFFVSVFLQDL